MVVVCMVFIYLVLLVFVYGVSVVFFVVCICDDGDFVSVGLIGW